MQDPNMPSPDQGKPADAPLGNEQIADPANGQPDPGNPNPAPADEVATLRAELDRVKQDYGASSREAQVLIEQIKAKDAQIEQLTKPHDPTDAELRAAYPEWDEMLPTEKRLARENLSLRKGLANTQQTTAELQADVRWGKDLKALVKKDEFKAHSDRLKGDDFEDYVFKPTHKGIPVDTLARSFLFGATPAPAPATPPAPASTGERGRGGQPPSAKKLSVAEAKTLRETNYEEYRRQLEADNIDFDV